MNFVDAIRLRAAARVTLSALAALMLAAAPLPSLAAVQEPMLPGSKLPASIDDPLLKSVSLDLRDMDIVDVLKFLSLKGKFNIAISKSIAGRVTLVMKEVTIGDALDIILRANNLAYQRTNNIIYVMTAEEYLNTYGRKFSDATDVKIVNLKYAKPSYVLAALDNIKSNVGKIVIDEDTGSVVLIDTPDNLDKMVEVLRQMDLKVVTKTYKLQYAAAKDIAAQLKQRLDAKSVGFIQADERSNQLVISAFPERLKEAEKIIRELDSPTKAVLIEVRILQLILNPKLDYGIDWSNPFSTPSNRYFRNLDVKSSFPISSTVSSIGTLGSITYGALDPSLLQLEISALKQVLNTRVVARPRLMVVNNNEANIHIGDTIPYVTSTTTGTGDTATVSEQINFIDVGLKLKVKPTINDDGIVTMTIRPEISSRTRDVETPQGALIPQVNTTFVETTAIVQDGHTVIIGGLKQLSNKNSKGGVPGLMDIPVAGHLFKNESKDLVDTEIVIFLTPHIIKPDHDQLREDRPTPQADRSYRYREDAKPLIVGRPTRKYQVETRIKPDKPIGPAAKDDNDMGAA
ncbi:MAG: Type IV pilus biogenesis and competence protein PilQ [Candidatus Omnitrophica bacterium]|nr:Type IV pilus biogenesis and competence protein PilQ [Candidatus Omnitrophota bacterium]